MFDALLTVIVSKCVEHLFNLPVSTSALTGGEVVKKQEEEKTKFLVFSFFILLNSPDTFCDKKKRA